MSVLGMVETKERPPLARFERRGVEDRALSAEKDRYMERDEDFALITPPGSRDIFVTTVKEWFDEMKRQVREQRLPEEWYERYQKQYAAWKVGEELPLDGSPIKTWGVISPAQQKNLITLNILTVEDLARLNDEGMRRIGMGAVDLRNKAIAWLKQLDDKGGLTIAHAALKAENEALKTQLDLLSKQVQALAAGKPIAEDSGSLLDEDDDLRNQYIAKFGKAPHHMMKPETIAKALQE